MFEGFSAHCYNKICDNINILNVMHYVHGYEVKTISFSKTTKTFNRLTYSFHIHWLLVLLYSLNKKE